MVQQFSLQVDPLLGKTKELWKTEEFTFYGPYCSHLLKANDDDMVKIYIQQEYTADKTKNCRMKSDGEIVIPSNSAKLLFLTEIF